MKITNTLSNEEIQDIKELIKLCDIERIPNFDPEIYVDSNIMGFYLEYKDNLLIGFLSLFYVDPKEIEIISVVHPSYRKMGYFNKLLTQAKKAIPPNLTLLYQIPSNCVDKKQLSNGGYIFHHGEEELINKTTTSSKNILIPLVEKDVPATAKIIADSFSSTLDEETEFLNDLLKQKNMHPFVLKEKDSIIGFIAVSKTNDVKTSHVFAFCVDEDYRSKGYGKKMLSNLPANPSGYVLRVAYDNTRARRLYTESGFLHLSSTEYYTKKQSN